MDVSLTEEDLNETDEVVLEILSEGRATPQLVREELKDRGKDVTRQYVSQILKRFREHGHVENLFDTGVYELTDDPRE
jgi:Fe2+ or Zn2+ uptake regulation protein